MGDNTISLIYGVFPLLGGFAGCCGVMGVGICEGFGTPGLVSSRQGEVKGRV
jgi:hypothetical protein